MKTFKKTSLFYALLLLSTTFNTHKTHTMEPEEPSVSAELPLEMYAYMINLLTKTSTTKTVQEAGKMINALAQTSPELHELINDPQFCFRFIKNLAQQFKCSDQEAAEALQTQEAKKRLKIQKKFYNLCEEENFNEQKFNDLYKKYKGYVDLNFTDKENITLLFIAAQNNNCPLIRTLLDHGADINKANKNGTTALMIATFMRAINAVKCLLNNPNIKINQQNKRGRTALFFTMNRYGELMTELLLNSGADPEITANDGRTALQDAQRVGNEEIINLIQNAIDKKHEKK